jgi:hypothetical protein
VSEQEIQLLRDLFESAGAIGSQGFDAMVRYTFTSGLAWLIEASVAFLMSLVAILAALLKDFDDDGINGALFFGGAIVGLISLLVGVTNLIDVIEPVGATVKALLSTATRS